jgi:hypothetical protein
MTPAQYKKAIASLGLSQRVAGTLFSVDERTSRRWALGERPIPPCVAIVLRLLASGKVTMDDVLAADH